MRLLTTVRKAPPAPTSVSADAVALVIGCSGQDLVQRFGSVGDDFMGRPILAFADAKLAHDECVWSARSDQIRQDYERYRENRTARRREAAEAAWAAAQKGPLVTPESFVSQGVAARAAREAFDLAEQELTITQFREQHQ